MRFEFRPRALLVSAAAAAVFLQPPVAAATTKPGPYAAFAKENGAAMDRMMTEMDVKPTGDVDADFVAMMVPHHQGAIDMANAVLRYGHNAKLKALARGIVEQQTKEIAIMRAAVAPRSKVAIPEPMHRHMAH